MKLLFLLLISAAAFGQDSAKKLTFAGNYGSVIRFPEHPTYLVFDSSRNEIIRYHQDSDTVTINPDKIHYIIFNGVVYPIETTGTLQGKPWYLIYPKIKNPW